MRAMRGQHSSSPRKAPAGGGGGASPKKGKKMVAAAEVQKAVARVKGQFESELAKFQANTKQVAFEFFKTTAGGNHEEYRKEMKTVLEGVDDAKLSLFENEKQVARLAETSMTQERILTETKSFMTESFSTIFNKVAAKIDIIDMHASQQLAPERQRLTKCNPLGLYTFYLDTVRPIEIKDNQNDLRETIKMKADEILALESELLVMRDVNSVYLEKERSLNARVKAAEAKAQRLLEALEREKDLCRSTVEEIHASAERRVREERSRREAQEQSSEQEFTLLRSLVNRALSQRADAMAKLQKVRGVLRAPRLWNEYREKVAGLQREANMGHVSIDELHAKADEMDAADR
jgi:hypothetical protein